MCVSVEDDVGHVTRADDRAGHDPGDFLPRTGKSQDVSGKHTNPLACLFQRSGGFRGLRIVDDNQTRPHVPAVAPLELHTTDTSGDAGNSDDDAGSPASFDGRQNDLVACPGDAGALALVELSGAAVRDPLQLCHRIAHLREVFGETLVDFQLGLQRIQKLQSR